MAFVNMHKNLCTKTELDIFAIPPTQNCIEGGQLHCYRPFSSLTDDAPIEFVIPGQGDEYIDLAHTMLHITANIEVPAVEVEKNVAPINNWMHSLFSQIDIFMNQKCVTPPSNNYNYRSYIENLLNYGSDAKSSHLTAIVWAKDTATFMDNVDDQNLGYVARKKLSENGRIIDMYGNLHCDIFNQDKYLINGVELSIRLQRSKNQFCLIGARNVKAKFKIIDAVLYTRKVKINSSILIAHARTLSVATAKYPITRIDLKTISISKDVQQKSIDNIYMGQLPKRCIIGFVKSRGFNGDITLNPYNFESFNHTFLCMYMDSVQIPSRPLTPDFANDTYIRSYHSLFSGCGIHFSDTGNAISREEYPGGFCLAAFDLTADLSSNEPHWNLIKSGSLRVEVKFDKPLAETVTIVIFAEFDNLIEIDKNRNVILDYSS